MSKLRRWRGPLAKVPGGRSARNVLTLFTGTALSQLLATLFLLPLARLYGPLEMGLFALFQAIALGGVSLASLRYDMAIVLPKSDSHARALQSLGRRIISVFSVLVGLVC